jgi:hypothetical protein
MINLEIDQLLSLDGSVRAAAEKAMATAAQSLAAATHGHIVEQVQQKLHSTRQKYLDHLNFKQVGKDTWIISLEPSAFFIEEGMPQHEMIDSLLGTGRGKKGSTAKTSKDGSRYKVIPFEHNKGPTGQTAKQTSLTDSIKKSMSQLKIPYGKLERDASGKPKTGLLHSFDILKKPNSMGGGDVEKGKHSGISLLQGVRVYQNQVKDKSGVTGVKRSIMTFRTVSSKMKGSGRWVHPGLQPRKFMDEAFSWALGQWERKIAPEILKQFSQEI